MAVELRRYTINIGWLIMLKIIVKMPKILQELSLRVIKEIPSRANGTPRKIVKIIVL